MKGLSQNRLDAINLGCCICRKPPEATKALSLGLQRALSQMSFANTVAKVSEYKKLITRLKHHPLMEPRAELWSIPKSCPSSLDEQLTSLTEDADTEHIFSQSPISALLRKVSRISSHHWRAWCVSQQEDDCFIKTENKSTWSAGNNSNKSRISYFFLLKRFIFPFTTLLISEYLWKTV